MSKGVSTTFTGNQTLGPYTAKGFPTDMQRSDGQDLSRLISFQFSGTWNSATVTLYVCNIPTASPQKWTAITDGAFAADAAKNILLPAGAIFKAVCSGSGSPIPSIYAAFRGQFD